MMQQIIITIRTQITPEAHEKLEDKLKELLENEGLKATIDNLATGNSTVTKPKSERATLGILYARELKKPDDVKELHNALEGIFGE